MKPQGECRDGWASNTDVFNAFYDRMLRSITLHYDWLHPVIAVAPQGGVHIGLCQPNLEKLLDFPEGSLPGVEVQAKFILAHEVGHAFHEGNPRVFDNFIRNVDLPLAALAWASPNPIISRNAWRDGFQFEVFSDVIAAFLYSPGLLNLDMTDWVDREMAEVLR